MTNFKFLSIVFLLTGLFFLTSCGSDADCESPNVFDEFISLSEDLVDLTITSLDPTNEAACNELIDALDNLIDEGENIQDCVPAADRAEFDESIQSFRDAREAAPCG